MSLALSFPLQVYFNSPLSALLPYLGILLMFVLDSATASENTPGVSNWNSGKPIRVLIIIYVALVVFQTAWQTIFKFISFYQGITAIAVFVFPAVFFLYFRKGVAEKEIRTILIFIAVAGLIVGGYFAYDSISKLVFHKVPEYNMYVHQYQLGRLGDSIGENPSRTSATSRSMGLLEKHTVSAAWISIGCFAALSLLPQHAIIQRVLGMTAYGVPLALGMNFTGLIGFLLVLLLFEFDGYSFVRGITDRRTLLKLFYSICAFIAAILIVSFFIDGGLIQAAHKVVKAQFEVISGEHVSRVSGHGYFVDLLSALVSFPGIISKFPPAIILGDGFTPGFGVLAKGGDYGFLDTICRLGVPLFVAVFAGFIRLIRRSFWQIRLLNSKEDIHANHLRFAASVMAYILFAEIHYSVWSSKSILPIVFLCLAIFSSCLAPSTRRSSSVPNIVK